MKLSHRWNVIGVTAGLLVYVLALTQLDLLVSPYVWTNIHLREVFSLPGIGEIYAWSGQWYNLLLWLSGVGLVIVAVSLWFWEDKEDLSEYCKNCDREP